MSPQIITNRYILLETVGEGSYSVVFRARDNDTGRIVALKELKSSGLTREESNEAQEIFFREISILKNLYHEALPRVYDFFLFEGRFYQVMEWIEGKNLLEILEEEGTIPEKTALNYMQQITDVLIYLQDDKRKIVYKDIKPSNIIVNEFGRVKLVDFGTARIYSRDKKKDTHVLGTPGYAPPEAYREEQTDFSADIYSLGVTMYHLVTGQEPYQFKFRFPDPSKFNGKISKELSCILKDCLLPRDTRIQSAVELSKRVDRYKVSPVKKLVTYSNSLRFLTAYIITIILLRILTFRSMSLAIFPCGFIVSSLFIFFPVLLAMIIYDKLIITRKYKIHWFISFLTGCVLTFLAAMILVGSFIVISLVLYKLL